MSKISRIYIYIICFLLILSNLNIVYCQEFDVDAKSAILIDAKSGKVLYEKNVHEKLPPASVTKIMTLLLAMEAIDTQQISLDDKVTISNRASSMGGSQLYMEPGEVQTVETLLKGITVCSANDACVAMAEHICGSEELFVNRMNERAKELKMNDTHFVNTNGLPVEGHYTSAYDISIMSRELLKHPKIHDWTTIWMTDLTVGLENKKQTNLQLTNTNKLIRTYPGANGLKTGYTSEAKYCLSASAKKDNTYLVAVILGSPTSKIRFNEAKKLLDYGFANYVTIDIVKKGDIIEKIPVEKGQEDYINIIANEDISVMVSKKDKKEIKKEIILPDKMKAPILQNDKIGEIIIYNGTKRINTYPLVSEKNIKIASFTDIYKKLVENIF